MTKFYKDFNFPIEKGNDDSDTDIVAIVSSDRADRDNDILHPKGMVANTHPMFMWKHGFDPGYQLPLGKINWLKKTTAKSPDGGRMKVVKAGFKFDGGDFPQTVKRMFEEGSLKYFSVGANIIDIKKREGEERGYDFFEWDLLEVSAVLVPSNLDTGQSKKHIEEWQKEYREGRFGKIPDRILRCYGITEKNQEEQEEEKGVKIIDDETSLETAENKGDQSAVEIISFPVLSAVEKEVIRFRRIN